MDELLRWSSGGDLAPGAQADLHWALVTIALIGAIATGYAVIAVNRYFQSKLGRKTESDAALARLRGIVLFSVVCGYVFFATDMSWAGWRLYDVALLAVAARTWWFAVRNRGLGLVDDRLAEVAELEQSARKYREIAELLPQMVWTATADGTVDFANQRWVEYAGSGRSWIDVVHPDERQSVHVWWARARAQRSAVKEEVRLGALGGGYRTFIVSATPIVEGDAVKWLGACADIEDQKALAIEKELQAKRKAFLLNALSHDLRAPLNNVSLNAHVLKMSARGEAEVESARAIVENAVAAGDLVTKLLDFARADAQDDNTLERVELGATLNQVVRRFLPLTEQKGLYLRVAQDVRGGDADVEITTDRMKLERIVSNLVDNAIKFTSHGGVVVELRTPATPGGGYGASGGAADRVAVRVSDTGIGIPGENAAYLFDEFYQVNNRERDRSKGFGMGLAICRSLARQLGGDVRLVSTGAGGSCFELILGRGATTGAANGGALLSGIGAAGLDIGPGRGGRHGRPDRDRSDTEERGLLRV